MPEFQNRSMQMRELLKIAKCNRILRKIEIHAQII